LSLQEQRAFFLIQSGVNAWEGTRPIPRRHLVTVSVVSNNLPGVMPLFWDIVASQATQCTCVFRIALARMHPLLWTRLQKQKFIDRLQAEQPGFSKVGHHISGTRACVVSKLTDPRAVHPDYLSAYLSSALLEANERIGPEAIERVWRTISNLGNTGIDALLCSVGIVEVLRVLDRETHAVIQLIGCHEAVRPAVRYLVQHRIAQLHDLREVPGAIASLH
jgi:hypothetical protein